MFLFPTDTWIALAAVAGICLAVFEVRSAVVIWLISPAVFRWLIFPPLASFGQPVLAYLLAHWWLILVLAVIAPFAALAFAARLFGSVLKLFLGPTLGGRAAGHMFGVWGIRVADWIFGRRRGRAIPEWDDEDEA